LIVKIAINSIIICRYYN